MSSYHDLTMPPPLYGILPLTKATADYRDRAEFTDLEIEVLGISMWAHVGAPAQMTPNQPHA